MSSHDTKRNATGKSRHPYASEQEPVANSPASSIPSMSDRASHHTITDDHEGGHGEHHDDNQAPPPYTEEIGTIHDDGENGDLGTNASVANDGRVNITINQRSKKLANILAPALRPSGKPEEPPPPPYIPPSLGGSPDALRPPSMNVVIHVVGSRGDVQPFVALGKVLKETYGHRVRLATHPTFQTFVEENGLEFFSIGGDPAELMAFMVKNPGLMPGIESLRNGDIGKRRKEISAMIRGCWRSCFEAGDGSGVAVNDDTVNEWMQTTDPEAMSPDAAAAAKSKPFVADCIIANPPSFAHIHCAERLGIPLHIMFTMPWSPTQAFPHPLANIQSSNADVSMSNYISYTLVDMLTWQGLGDVINSFRVHTLSLEPISLFWAPGILGRMRVPHTYCWSPALIPKPADWAAHISISGFYFLSLASNFTPEPDLKTFLDAGPPPVYIGFGSIVVDDPNAMTQLIFQAVKKTGQRALVSKGWGGLGADQLGIPDGVFMLGNVPHDWLFQHVSCVVHHGGAGTTAAGIASGKPTVVVPFFGDQPFWGAMVAKAGAGPAPIAYKDLSADQLAESIDFCLKPESQERAKELAFRISKENGTQLGAQSFHQMLDVDSLRCSLLPTRTAVWRVKRTKIRLSAVAAYALASQDVINYDDLKLYRPREWEGDMGPTDPVSGASVAIVGTASTILGGVADVPIQAIQGLANPGQNFKKKREARLRAESSSTSAPSLTSPSTSTLTGSARSADRKQTMSESPTDFRPTSPIYPDDSASIADTFDTATSDSTRLEPTISGDSLETRSTITQTTTNTSVTGGGEMLNVPLSGESTRGRHSSMAEVLHSLSETSRPHSPNRSNSRHSRSNSRAGSPGRSGTTSPTQAKRVESCHIAPDPLDTVYGTGKGISKIIGAGLKAPLDFTMAVSKGFHNVPGLYGEEVRQVDRVTGVKSGLRTAGKEFGVGLFDGITGLITQPMQGAKKEGGAGFIKGIGRGLAGIVVKPSAAAYALPAYAMMGVYKEIQKRLGENVGSYIIAARVAQGYADFLVTDENEKRTIVHKWAECLSEVKGKRGLGKTDKGDKAGMQAIKQFVDKRKEKRKLKHVKGKEGASYNAAMQALNEPSTSLRPQTSVSSASSERMAPDAEDEDAELEEAIRLSMRVEDQQSSGTHEEDTELKKAITASLEQMRQVDEDHDDEHLRQAIEESVRTHRPIHHVHEDDDEDMRKAMEESKKRTGPIRMHDEELHEDELQKAIEESKKHGESSATTGAATHDEELQKAIEESKKHDEEQRRLKDEEEALLEHVRQQSLQDGESSRQGQSSI
ncbi:UDP-Glycosyltransferase/glycogen phosphorylase [Microthyrium microscopicum]|uniref:UDP-Glycosyltransferase/glycogen phosphorylase n=1 Tax=Microthyrium microscopicum TaxID=703497 RepID=A0A6A6U985_9PEZI|nr:UDP-Glycosyltransferase/glycogen phosphorylase [Microthyrium microscopicum]